MLHLLLTSPLNAFQCRVVLSFLPFLRSERLRVGDRNLFELGTCLGTTNAELRVMLAAPEPLRSDPEGMRRHVRYETHPGWTVLWGAGYVGAFGLCVTGCYHTALFVVTEMLSLLNITPNWISLTLASMVCVSTPLMIVLSTAGAVLSRWVYPLLDIPSTLTTVTVGMIGGVGTLLLSKKCWDRWRR